MTGSAARPGRQRLDAVVRGMVQGVGFRWFVQRVASELDLDGWVANQPDGSVAVQAEGPVEALDALLAALRGGPAGAWVSAVDARRSPAVGSAGGFSIRSAHHPGD